MVERQNHFLQAGCPLIYTHTPRLVHNHMLQAHVSAGTHTRAHAHTHTVEKTEDKVVIQNKIL